MHVFSDSSREAYAVMYFGRFVRIDDAVSVRFLIGKCKAYLIKDSKEKMIFLQLSVSPLTAQERSNAENYMIKSVQKDYFGKLYDYVQSLNGNICFKVKKDLKIAF